MVKKFDLNSEAKAYFEMEESLNASQNLDFTGNFYGIGIDLNKNQLFFSFNGRVINTLDFKILGEIRYAAHEMRKQDLLDDDDRLEDKDKLNDFTGKLDLTGKVKTKIKKHQHFKSRWSNYLYPVIYIQNMAVIRWNIGALPFKIKDPMGSGIIGLIKEN